MKVLSYLVVATALCIAGIDAAVEQDLLVAFLTSAACLSMGYILLTDVRMARAYEGLNLVVGEINRKSLGLKKSVRPNKKKEV